MLYYNVKNLVLGLEIYKVIGLFVFVVNDMWVWVLVEKLFGYL